VVEQGVEAMWKQSGTSARAVHARKPPVYRHLWHVRGMWRQFLKTKTCFITNFFADVRRQSFCHILIDLLFFPRFACYFRIYLYFCSGIYKEFNYDTDSIEY
jgi:hypothetical protein